jgi:hypothetical protein
LYVWDFDKKKIKVLDPKEIQLGREDLNKKHKTTCNMMDSAIKECWEFFFKVNRNNDEIWETEYIRINGGEVER